MLCSYLLAAWRDSGSARLMRAVGCVAVMAALSACAGHPRIDQAQEAARYEQHAARSYKVPGPPSDPWGPYVTEASARFDVPERWIREVMRVESGGLQYQNGQLTTSGAGAMGLMQVMPETYDYLHDRYSLGDDAYDPHNNILAGTAYMREMYDAYGTPAFLAAYNAGPNRLEDYLYHNRPLPDETRHYVAKIGPHLAGIYPNQRSPAEDLAINQVPIEIPPGPRYARAGRSSTALAAMHAKPPPSGHGETRIAQLPTPPSVLALPSPRVQTALALPPHVSGFHLISAAAADTLPVHRGGAATGNWAIQVGAFANESQARSAADAARNSERDARAEVGPVHQPHGTLYRARLTGLSREAAIQACERLGHGKPGCIVLSPAAQL